MSAHVAGEEVARHQPDDLVPAADHNLGRERQPARELSAQSGAAHRPPDDEGPGGPDVDGVEMAQLPGECGQPTFRWPPTLTPATALPVPTETCSRRLRWGRSDSGIRQLPFPAWDTGTQAQSYRHRQRLAAKPTFRAGSGITDYHSVAMANMTNMSTFFAYDFGYTWSLRYAMLVPLALAVGLAGLAVWRSWSRWVYVPLVLVALWAAGAVVIPELDAQSPHVAADRGVPDLRIGTGARRRRRIQAARPSACSLPGRTPRPWAWTSTAATGASTRTRPSGS